MPFPLFPYPFPTTTTPAPEGQRCSGKGLTFPQEWTLICNTGRFLWFLWYNCCHHHWFQATTLVLTSKWNSWQIKNWFSLSVLNQLQTPLELGWNSKWYLDQVLESIWILEYNHYKKPWKVKIWMDYWMLNKQTKIDEHRAPATCPRLMSFGEVEVFAVYPKHTWYKRCSVLARKIHRCF